MSLVTPFFFPEAPVDVSASGAPTESCGSAEILYPREYSGQNELRFQRLAFPSRHRLTDTDEFEKKVSPIVGTLPHSVDS